MTPPPPGAAAVAATVFLAFVFLFRPFPVDAFGGSSTTVAVSYGSSPTVCSLVADQSTHQIQCWRDGKVKPPIYAPSASFDSIASGQDLQRRHACGMNTSGVVICRGDNNGGQFVPSNLVNEYSALALGANHSCAIRKSNKTGVGGGFGFEKRAVILG